ncbi:copper amine oxidase N-terminal domain-containing protein [Marinicrinis lubricantis]|uniref:Copper amine oxidase N-terminal domain-containing protein n=1 Tax=Marinicrinis lubricantis TaxID=2086470 RepID=A0ABW1IUP8_9BACL
MKKWIMALLAAGMLFPNGQADAETGQVHFYLNNEKQLLQQAPYVLDGRVYVPLREIGNKLDARTVWDGENKTVYMWSPDSSLEWTLGSENMMVNGQSIKTDAAPMIRNQSIYVPIRFISDAFGAPISWDSSSYAVTLNQEPNRYYSTELSKAKIWLDPALQKLYISEGKNPTAVIEQLQMDSTEWLSMEAAVIDDTSYLITIQSVTGEPHLHTYQYRYLVSEGELRHHTQIDYYGFKSTVNRSVFDGKAVMLDSTTLEIVNTSGNVEHSYPLQEYTGMEGPFIVEQVYEDYLLVRPYRLDALVLIDLENKRATTLYEALLSEEEQSYLEERYSDGEGIMFDYPGDQIRFVKREGDTFHFTYKGLFDNKEYNVEYEVQ